MRIEVEDATTRFDELMERVGQGEVITLTRGGSPVVTLNPAIPRSERVSGASEAAPD